MFFRFVPKTPPSGGVLPVVWSEFIAGMTNFVKQYLKQQLSS
jgi:hypothetical protein